MLGTDYARILRTIYALAQAIFLCYESNLPAGLDMICFVLCFFGGLFSALVVLNILPLCISFKFASQT